MVGKVTPDTILSASQLPAVMGFSPWSTANDVLARVVAAHRGEAIDTALANSDAAELGNVLEPVILRLCAKRLGVLDRLTLDLPTARFADGVPIACSLDGWVREPLLLDVEENEALRIKVMNDFGSATLKGNGVFEAKYSTGHAKDEPELHRGPIQLQAQMLCTGAHWGAVCVFYGASGQVVTYVYERDIEVMATIVQVCDDFQRRLETVLAGGSGWFPPQSTAEAARMFPGDEEQPALVLPPEAGQILRDLADAKRTIEIGERVVEECSTAIMEMLGNHMAGSVRDADGVTYHVKWPTRTMKPQPEKIVPAKPGGTIRLKTLQVKEVRS